MTASEQSATSIRQRSEGGEMRVREIGSPSAPQGPSGPDDAIDNDTSPGAHVDSQTHSDDLITPDDPAECQDLAEDASEHGSARAGSIRWAMAFGALPAAALIIASAAGYLDWQAASLQQSHAAADQAVHSAIDSTIAMLSYQPDTVDKQLNAARDRLTGTFRDSYTGLTNDVVIPGAKQQHISSVVTVPAAATVSSNANHVVALLYVNQVISMGNDPPTSTASAVRVTLDRIDSHWLISGFEPV